MAPSKHKLVLIALAVSGVVTAIAIARPVQNLQRTSGTGATYGCTEVGPAVVNQTPPAEKQTVPAEPELTETVPAESKPAEFEPVETQTPWFLIKATSRLSFPSLKRWSQA